MSGLCGSSDDDRRRCDGHPPQAPGPTEAPVAPTTAPEPTAAPVTVPDTTGVAAGQCARDPQVITDTVFEDENWLHNFVVNTPEGEPWVILDGLIGQDRWGERRLDTGRPDPSRWVWYAWDGDNAPAYALISHRYIGEEVTGPVDSLKFAYDAWANSVNVAPLLIQGETCYAADGLFGHQARRLAQLRVRVWYRRGLRPGLGDSAGEAGLFAADELRFRNEFDDDQNQPARHENQRDGELDGRDLVVKRPPNAS